MIRSFSQQARIDADHFAALLLAKGGTDIRANGEIENDRAFREVLYSIRPSARFFSLRSGQNMGSGSVVYGSRLTTGTLVNGPTWGANGITFVQASSQCINLLSLGSPFYQDFTCMCVTAVSGSAQLIAGNLVDGGNGWAVSSQNSQAFRSEDGGQLFQSNDASTAIGSGFASIALSWSNSGTALIVNGSANIGATVIQTGTMGSSGQLRLASRGTNYSSNQQMALALFCSPKLTAAEVLLVHAAYRDTLGHGLLLP